MAFGIKELQKLPGVGEVLSRRILEAGYDSFAKIAAAGEDEMRKIPGINPRMVGSIVSQAALLSEESTTTPADRAEGLKLRTASLKKQAQGVALSVRNRFKEKAAGKKGSKVAKEILKIICALEKMETALKPSAKKAGTALTLMERRLDGLGEAGLKKIGRRLKKARKKLETVIS